MNNFGDNLNIKDSKVADVKEFIDDNKEALHEENNFIDQLKHDVEGYTPSILETESISDNNETEKVAMNVLVDPATGEHKIIGRAGEEVKYNFEGVIKQINEGDPDILTSKPFTEQEIISYLQSADDDTLVKELAGDINISAQALRELLEIVNRRLKGEKFNAYRESPDEVKLLVDSYVSEGLKYMMPVNNSQSLNAARNRIATNLIDEFIHNIKMDRAKTDFAKELENIYNNSSIMVSEEGLEYIEERNAAYREATNAIADENKRSRMNDILDRIEEARNLTELKEFAKTCKIKRFDIERPDKRVYSAFLSKYRDSVNNIYDITIAETVLTRQLAQYGCDKIDVIMLLIAFCKQCKNYSVDNVLDHAYMYYFLYYCVMLDGDKSDKFRNNLLEVIKNVNARNKF